MLKLIFIKLLEISIQTSFFILAIMFIRLCFKQMPKRYMCILWALLAIRLILPFEITSTFSLGRASCDYLHHSKCLLFDKYRACKIQRRRIYRTDND